MNIREYDDHLFREYIEKVKHGKILNNRILLINPPIFDVLNVDIEVAERKGYYTYPPTGLLFLATALKQHDIEVEICDLNYQLLKNIVNNNHYSENLWNEILDDCIEKFKPTFLGLTCMFSHFKNVYENILTYLNKKDQYIILAGGTHASFEYEELLKKELSHFVIVKDGEDRLPLLLNRILKNGENEEPLGGIYFKYEGLVYSTKGEEKQPQIDLNINKAYELIPIEDYTRVGSLNQFSRICGADKPFSAISMNRGCRGNCDFCSVRSLLGKEIRTRSVENIISEIRYLTTKRGVCHFDLLDDDFLANKTKAKELLKEIINQNFDIRWYANNGLMASSIDEELLNLMVKSGCVGFKIGIETGNEEMLKKTRKPVTLKNLLSQSILFNKHQELFVAGNYIIGFPNETFEQMLDTFLFSNQMNIDWAGFYICQPIKGTDVFRSFETIYDDRCENKPKNYIPSRDMEQDSSGKNEKYNVYEGMDIFLLNKNETVTQEQLKEVWFTFGFITNFINNKNLKEGYDVNKFIDWVEVALAAYPTDAGMMLFLYFSYTIAGNLILAEKYFKECTRLVEKSTYWEKRFKQFYLTASLEKLIIEKIEILNILTKIKGELKIKYAIEI